MPEVAQAPPAVELNADHVPPDGGEGGGEDYHQQQLQGGYHPEDNRDHSHIGGDGDRGMSVDSAAREANRLVDGAIASAYKQISANASTPPTRQQQQPCSQTPADREERGEKGSEVVEGSEEVFVGENGLKDIRWMSYEQFTVPLGTHKIQQFVETWEYEPSWKYCIDFLEEDSTEYDFRYRYQVRWSIPTRRKPIPRATARVFFTIVVSKIRPQHLPCQVFYKFETNSLVHRPGQSRFRQKWLSSIVENQCHVIANVQF